ncbi:MAG: hypothetical protein IPM27_08145 [Nitrosomonadales bacterium]|nr:hypothetical protein [Nitrosomonadales bacterium]
MQRPDPGKMYRHILILESGSWWENGKASFDPASDVVLTYDLGLKREVEAIGGRAFYVDHLVDNLVMQENNFLVYQFFREWHRDAGGADIFEYRGVPFGFSFRLEIWNDLVFYARTRICLETLRSLRFEKLLVGTELGLIESVLDEMGLPFTRVPESGAKDRNAYYFPIHRWMDEKVRYQGIGGVKYLLRDMAGTLQGILMSWIDLLTGQVNGKPAIFVQEYHPTRKLVQRLQQDSRVRLVLASFSRSKGWFRYVPVWGSLRKYQGIGLAMMREFHSRRSARLVLTSGTDIADGLYRIFERRISNRIAESLRTLDCVMRYLDRNPVRLEVLIANIGHVAPLMDCVCKSRNIPSYLIINGMLGNDFLDEGKYATVINSYSVSIREHYFRGMDNIVCLGDPRMDDYVRMRVDGRSVNRDEPTVTIGASGHNNMDLNSYLAVEFEFLHDVLQGLRIAKERDARLRIVIKVRANGYRWQYEAFAKEYFPGLVDEIVDNVPMSSVLEKTDFFISIYSQTLFEASCLGIPCLYYKKDNEIIDPPFDGRSELVTVGTVEGLVEAFADFRAGHERYNAFLAREVMEKYIGPLDGGNLERNLDFVYGMLEKRQTEMEQ